MKLVTHPNDGLETECKDVDLENPGFDPKELKTQMVDFMLSGGGIGLSANQVGLNIKVFVMSSQD